MRGGKVREVFNGQLVDDISGDRAETRARTTAGISKIRLQGHTKLDVYKRQEVGIVMEAAAKSPALSLRDTAMFSIAASLGMRAGDIVRLPLSAIDWVHHEVRFVQGKTGVELCLPLEASV